MQTLFEVSAHGQAYSRIQVKTKVFWWVRLGILSIFAFFL